MKVAFQMDPIGSVNIEADSTFRLAEEAQARGHELWHYTPDCLSFREGRVVARAQPLTVQRVQGDHAHLGDTVDLDLAEVDVVWLRQDPPFDMGYITTTHILDRLKGRSLVVNDPFWVAIPPKSCSSSISPISRRRRRSLATSACCASSRPSMATSSSSRFTAMAGRACSGSTRTIATSPRCTSCSPG
jgi:hypothetical protein